jgi:site-specific DNA-cytosine methylase
MNCHRAGNRSIVAEASGRTGRVFHHILSALQKNHDTFRCGVFENVVGLQVGAKDEHGVKGNIYTSNLSTCVQLLFAAGFFIVTVLLDPRRFGHPQHRERLY